MSSLSPPPWSTYFAKVIFCSDQEEKYVPVTYIRLDDKSESHLDPRSVKDFVPKHEYLVKWYICGRQGVKCSSDECSHDYSEYPAHIQVLGVSPADVQNRAERLAHQKARTSISSTSKDKQSNVKSKSQKLVKEAKGKRGSATSAAKQQSLKLLAQWKEHNTPEKTNSIRSRIESSETVQTQTNADSQSDSDESHDNGDINGTNDDTSTRDRRSCSPPLQEIPQNSPASRRSSNFVPYEEPDASDDDNDQYNESMNQENSRSLPSNTGPALTTAQCNTQGTSNTRSILRRRRPARMNGLAQRIQRESRGYGPIVPDASGEPDQVMTFKYGNVRRPLKRKASLIASALTYYNDRDKEGYPEYRKRYKVINGMVQLGLGIVEHPTVWGLLEAERNPLTFLTRVKDIIWDPLQFYNSSFEPETINEKNMIPGQDPVQQLDKKKLDLLLSLYDDYLKRRFPRAEDSATRVDFLMRATDDLSRWMRNGRAKLRKNAAPAAQTES